MVKKIFYRDARQFLLDWLAERQRQDPRYSVRRCAQDMGISHSLLLLLTSGKRPIKLKHAPALTQALKLSSHERIYLQALIEFSSAKSIDQKTLLAQYLTSLHPGRDYSVREVEEFKVISSWLHLGCSGRSLGSVLAKLLRTLQSNFFIKSERHIKVKHSFIVRVVPLGYRKFAKELADFYGMFRD